MARKNKAKEVPADIYQVTYKKSRTTSRGERSIPIAVAYHQKKKLKETGSATTTRAEVPSQPDDQEYSDAQGDGDHYIPEYRPSQGTTQNEFLQQFLLLENIFLQVLLETYRAPPVAACTKCHIKSARWRCRDCHLHPFICRGCMRGSHHENPLHRIEKWTGSFFTKADLWEVGVRLAFGHKGFLCPRLQESLNLMEEREKELDSQEQKNIERFVLRRGAQLADTLHDYPHTGDNVNWNIDDPNESLGQNTSVHSTEHPNRPSSVHSGSQSRPEHGSSVSPDAHEIDENEDTGDWEDEDDELGDKLTAGVPREDSFGTPFITIVHTNGVHHLPMLQCSVDEHANIVMDPFFVGYFPASFKEPRTFFTWQVLDDFRVQNLECKTTPYGFYQVLRRKTNPLFPKTVPNRYTELRRLSRQWQKLKKLKWHGFGQEYRAASLGDLVTFCANCPQPNINLPENWQEDPDKNLYLRSFVADGNFSADHLKQKRPEADVWLLNGRGMITPRYPYRQHLAVAKESKSLINLVIALKDATGIVAIACARHGCYAPSSVVDLQKGERQANVDWAFTQALKTTNILGLARVLLIYDIVCQYHIHFQQRINVNDYLILPDNVTIDQAIGLFHVHGHKDECFFRFATTFIPGAAIVDGEVLETLWSTLNNISPSTRTATLAHREEILDDHMDDSNIKKIIGSVDAISKKYKTAVKSAAASEEYFKRLTDAANRRDPALVPKWETAIQRAEEDRINNPAAMDIMNTALPKPKTKAQKQLELVEAARSILETGSINAMVNGLKLEEDQFELESFVKQKGAYPTKTDRLEISRRRDKLRQKIEKFQMDAGRLIGEDILQEITGDREPTSDDYDSYATEDEEARQPHGVPGTLPELLKLPFPSAIPALRRLQLGLTELAKYELELRMGQANDCLQAIRLAIGQKSFLYREGVRSAPRKTMMLRSRSAITTLTQQIAHQCHIYSRCRNAMVLLGLEEELLATTYKPIAKQDLKTSTTVMNPNEPGHSRDQLSWIWTAQVGPTVGPASNHLTECRTKTSATVPSLTNFSGSVYRVHWLRARAQSLRWSEELKLTSHEMKWTTLFFLNRKAQWHRWRSIAIQKGEAGQSAHAAGMMYKWYRMAKVADQKFSATSPTYDKLVCTAFSVD